MPLASVPADSRKYCLITPCRNEAKFAAATISSVERQSIPPALWVFVNDGSSDETPKILAEFAQQRENVVVINRTDRGGRLVGQGVIDAFNDALAIVDLDEFEFLCKLDLDLILPPRYFELLIRQMDRDPRLGTCSGKPFFRSAGLECDEVCGDENSVGMTKFYRTSCFQDINGFVPAVMWDGIDCHRCRMRGWKAASFTDLELRFEHLRPMGSSHKSIWHGRKRHGEGQYFMGTGPVYLLASAIYRIAKKPRLIGSLAMVWGYISAAYRAKTRYNDKEFSKFLRRFQWKSLLFGKKRAVTWVDRSSEAIWKQHQDRLIRTDRRHILHNSKGSGEATSSSAPMLQVGANDPLRFGGTE